MLLKGSCLCGSVNYEINGEPTAFYHCHCQRCRKATATGHASNIRVTANGITWTTGEDQLCSYKVPEAERFRNDFCGQCGSPMPRFFPQMGMVVLPAGTLDTPVPELPQSRIFYASRASWSCADNLPAFDEYPV